MKYTVSLYRHQSIDVEVDAENKSEAVNKAMAANPHFKADTVVDENGTENDLFGHCEGCGVDLWDGEDFAVTDDGDFCAKCVQAMQEHDASMDAKLEGEE